MPAVHLTDASLSSSALTAFAGPLDICLAPAAPPSEASGEVLPIITASVALHLLIVSWMGAGIPLPVSRPALATADSTTAAIVDVVQLEEQPTPLESEPVPPQPNSAVPDLPPPPAATELPSLPQVQAIVAVPSTIPVAFGIEPKGPVRLVSDAANASGGGLVRRPTEPIALDLAGESNLLLPPLSYPLRAKKQRLTGTVLVRFRTDPTGRIFDVRVHQSSGHALLDQAAEENLQAGRWKGAPGLYVKAFEFTLK